MSKQYIKCPKRRSWKVIVDSKVVLFTYDKEEATLVLEDYLANKKRDNIYLEEIKSVRYTLLEE